MGIAASSSGNIPPEIVEEILLNLPEKSVLRFSTVSKSWNSMISDERFIRKYRSRAALPGRGLVLIGHSRTDSLTDAATLPLSSMISNQGIDHKTPLILPTEVPAPTYVNLLASCGDLWLIVYVYRSSLLVLWNPSTRAYNKEFPFPPMLNPALCFSWNDDFAIGYDCVGDDYKLLQVGNPDYLYSLRSDSWKKIPPLPRRQNCNTPFVSCGGAEFVSCGGAVYWLSLAENSSRKYVIIAFDLSTEMHAEVAQPPYDLALRLDLRDRVKLTVIRGKLCLHVNYSFAHKYVLWVREDCEGGNSWTKMFDIDHCSIRYTQLRSDGGEEVVRVYYFTALYFYDNGDMLIKAIAVETPSQVTFMYKHDQSIPQIVRRYNGPIHTDIDRLYFESLASPAAHGHRIEN